MTTFTEASPRAQALAATHPADLAGADVGAFEGHLHARLDLEPAGRGAEREGALGPARHVEVVLEAPADQEGRVGHPEQVPRRPLEHPDRRPRVRARPVAPALLDGETHVGHLDRRALRELPLVVDGVAVDARGGLPERHDPRALGPEVDERVPAARRLVAEHHVTVRRTPEHQTGGGDALRQRVLVLAAQPPRRSRHAAEHTLRRPRANG